MYNYDYSYGHTEETANTNVLFQHQVVWYVLLDHSGIIVVSVGIGNLIHSVAVHSGTLPLPVWYTTCSDLNSNAAGLI